MNQEEIKKATELMHEMFLETISAAKKEFIENEVKRKFLEVKKESFHNGFWIGSILTAIGVVLTAWVIHKI